MGPTLRLSQERHAQKYRGRNESFEECIARISGTLSDSPEHFRQLQDILGNQRFLPAGRIQAAIGSPKQITAFNCFVSGTIHDTSASIFQNVSEAWQTLRMGGGDGYGFGNLRPRGDLIRTLDAQSAGVLPFMNIFDATCAASRSAGHRRGAQMGVLPISHPDIEEFIEAKTNLTSLTNFNLSVAVTDEFMDCLANDRLFDLRFEGRVYRTVSAKALWDKIMRANWDWAEPGVLFIDRINYKNNLWYCEDIVATNPCGEQPLPPHGACLLGSFNLTKYLQNKYITQGNFQYQFDFEGFINDIFPVVRAMDNVIDNTIYPLKVQENEAKYKRRMGIGVTGVANTLELMGFPYGSSNFLLALEAILITLRDNCYLYGIELSIEKGCFKAYDGRYLDSGFAQSLPENIRSGIAEHGIRNSHYLSVAPTGTISLCADNISTSIEPVFAHSFTRDITDFNEKRTEEVRDWAYENYGFKGRTALEVTPKEHVDVLNLASKYVDSACSKTCNVGETISWEDFKDMYLNAYYGGASGCAIFRPAGKRHGVLNAKPNSEEEQGAACYINPETGTKTCD